MCGIAGFIGEGMGQDLNNMIQVISYRGPDDKGVFLRGNVGFAHARLSIIDLSSAGHQPMLNNIGTVAIVFNGEIYNFKELKNLVSGYPFKSKSDTEVILALYDKYGEKAFEKLDGMFAIALYDFENQKLILVRDRLGKKPLYWGIFDGTLIFGSEIKALIAHPVFRKELDRQSLSRYLLYEYVPTPYSIWKNVSKLEAGYYAVFKSGAVDKHQYWFPGNKKFNGTFREAENQLDKLLEEAVHKRLVVADVPVGIFLSGGLDSSTVAYYAQKNNPRKVETFSIGFQEKSFDESNYAKQIAEYLGSNHHSQIVSASDILALIPTIAQLMDEPLADASILPTYLLSKYTRGKVTVALSGDGGDELFAGYPTFQAEIGASVYQRIPKFIREKWIKPFVGLIPASETNFSVGFKIKQFVENFHDDKNKRHQVWRGSFAPIMQNKLFSASVIDELNKFDPLNDLDTGQSLLESYQKTYLLDDILVKADRASMYNSLEVRAPFLDTAVVEFVNNLPYEYKCRGLTTKYILKRLMTDKLPISIVNRQKKGFGIPMARWLKHELNGLCRELLSEDRIRRDRIFNPKYVTQLVDDHMAGKKDNRKPLWTLMVFQMWYNQWF